MLTAWSMANIRSPIGTDKSSREMWVDDEGKRCVGGFFIDHIRKNFTEDEQAGEKLTRGSVSNNVVCVQNVNVEMYLFVYYIKNWNLYISLSEFSSERSCTEQVLVNCETGEISCLNNVSCFIDSAFLLTISSRVATLIAL